MKLEYRLIRSKRKTVAINIGGDLCTIVRAPMSMSNKKIEEILIKHSDWIEKHKQSAREYAENNVRPVLSDQEIGLLKQKAKVLLPERVAIYSNVMGVNCTGIKITSAKTRWGSCSPKNSLSFAYRLVLLPIELIDYVVVHELAHIRVRNHSSAFYKEVETYLPNYRMLIAQLKQIQKSLPK